MIASVSRIARRLGDLGASKPTSDWASQRDQRARRLEEGAGPGAPSAEDLHGPGPDSDADDLLALSGRIKAELQDRFDRGERPSIHEYLERYPRLRADGERVVSLIYEEFCLREECGLGPTPESFCDRYGAWRDSLASQLRYHRLLSRVVGPPPRPVYPQPGETFADAFRLRAVLGEGGAAKVYLAEQPELGDRAVALKVSAGRSKESSIQGRLDHRHIVPVWSVVDDAPSGLRGLCMPYRPGQPLDRIIRRIEPAQRPRSAQVLRDAAAPQADAAPEDAAAPGWAGFPTRGPYADGAAWVVATIARALAHAHARGIQHRDVKPANILLTHRDGPQLLDFNLAHEPHAADQAEAALRGGTLPYMAPEQLLAFRDPERWGRVGPAADLYSLGLVLDELLTGERPAAPPDDLPLPRVINDLLDRRAAPRRPARAVNRDVPHALDAILARCLAYDPADRYSSADALAEDLERFLRRQPLRHAHNPSRREAVGNWLGRRRWAFLVGLALLGTGAGLAPVVQSSIEWILLDPAALAATAIDRAYRGEFDAASVAARKALARDPDSWVARLALAHIANIRDNDPLLSVRYYDEALDLMRRDQAQIRPRIFAEVLVNRAFVSIGAAALIRNRDESASGAAHARARYEAALRDAERSGDFKVEGDRGVIARQRMALAQAQIGLGDLALGGDDPAQAGSRYETALGHARECQALAEGEVADEVDSIIKEHLQPRIDEVRSLLGDAQVGG